MDIPPVAGAAFSPLWETSTLVVGAAKGALCAASPDGAADGV
jgi:hypothetical protein